MGRSLSRCLLSLFSVAVLFRRCLYQEVPEFINTYVPIIPEVPDEFRICFPNQTCVEETFDTTDHLTQGFDKYKDATELYLMNGEVLNLTRYFYPTVDKLMEFNMVLHTCLSLANDPDRIFLSITVAAVEGKCGGPQIDVINNKKLVGVEFGATLLKNFGNKIQPIRVRGNRQIWEYVYTNFTSLYSQYVDFQPLNECPLPYPLTTLDEISEDDCTQYFGALTVPKGITTLLMPPEIAYKYSWEGCVNIRNTDLRDVGFMAMFKNFTTMKGCRNEIRGNKQLCIGKDAKVVETLIGDIDISDNRYSCYDEECAGGHVSNDYLLMMGKCSTVYGDLIISGWKVKPQFVEILRNIKHIKGRLIITKNSNMGVFDHFANLETVERLKGRGPLIIIRDNPDLIDIDVPALKDIQIRKDDPRVELDNNPMLTDRHATTIALTTASRTTTKTATTTTTTTTQNVIYVPPTLRPHTPVVKDDTTAREYTSSPAVIPISPSDPSAVKRGDSLKSEEPIGVNSSMNYIYVTVGSALFIVFILAVVVVVFLAMFIKKNSLRLPAPPYKLSRNSRRTLSSMSEEISSKDPVAWSSSDKELLWRPGRSAGGGDPEVRTKTAKRPYKFSLLLARTQKSNDTPHMPIAKTSTAEAQNPIPSRIIETAQPLKPTPKSRAKKLRLSRSTATAKSIKPAPKTKTKKARRSRSTVTAKSIKATPKWSALKARLSRSTVTATSIKSTPNSNAQEARISQTTVTAKSIKSTSKKTGQPKIEQGSDSKPTNLSTSHGKPNSKQNMNSSNQISKLAKGSSISSLLSVHCVDRNQLASLPYSNKALGNLKMLMIPLAVNGVLPTSRSAECDKFLLQRVQELLKFEYVIMLGSGGEVSRIVSRLPHVVKATSVYVDKNSGATYAFKLVELNQLSARTAYYKYEVKDVNKRKAKSVAILYYDCIVGCAIHPTSAEYRVGNEYNLYNEVRWPSNKKEIRLPTEFEELLQILRFCHSRKVICMSNRRKEVFSLMSLLYKVVLAGKRIKIEDVIKFHLYNCNGAPLDRDELIFVFRLILDWAEKASCTFTDKQKINSWCQTYAHMASFASAHPNIRNIRSVYLVGDNVDVPVGMDSSYDRVLKAERPRANMIIEDRFKKKGQEGTNDAEDNIKTALVRVNRTWSERKSSTPLSESWKWNVKETQVTSEEADNVYNGYDGLNNTTKQEDVTVNSIELF